MLRTVRVMRYVTALREGGSVPAIVEADDDGTYVLKFRGAAQGPKALVAELVAGEIGRALGLPVPEIVLVDLDPVLGRSEPDPEIQQLIVASGGTNLALDYLPGSLTFDPVVYPSTDAAVASSIVWFDAYVSNVDRTARNTNMLMWHKRLWLIDHGASLYFHHSGGDYRARSRDSFKSIKDHVLLSRATQLAEIDASLRSQLSEDRLREIVESIPADWLDGTKGADGVEPLRAAYLDYLVDRLNASNVFVEEALNARAQLV